MLLKYLWNKWLNNRVRVPSGGSMLLHPRSSMEHYRAPEPRYLQGGCSSLEAYNYIKIKL